MAFVSEIVAKMGLDTTSFKAALTKTTADVGRAGDDIGRKLNRAFGAGDVFKGLLQGLGIQSVQSVVDKLTDGFKDAADNAKEIEQLTRETADIYDKIFSARRTDEQNIAVLRQRDNRLLKEEQEIRDAAAKEITTTTMTGTFGVRQTTTAAGMTAEQERRIVEIAKERAQIQAESESLQKRIDETETKRVERLEEQTRKYEDALKKLADDRAAFERESMTNEEALKQLTVEKLDIEARLSDDVARSDDEELKAKQRILDVEKEIARVNEKIVDDNIRKAEAEIRNEKALKAAQEALADSQKSYRNSFKDRSAFTISELAQGGSGINQTLKDSAREIQRLERQARRQRATGFEAAAERSTERALELRKRLGALTTSERDPLAQSAEAIKKSEAHLNEIKNSLAPSSVQ
jgi:hypothetical protein